MNIPPLYQISHTMLTLIAQIETNRATIQNTQIPEKIILNLTHQSLLKSSVFSAQIEGNTLSVDDIENKTEEEEKNYERQEVENIITALSYIRDKGIPQLIDLPFTLQLHRLVMHKLVHESLAGHFRKEPSAIFDNSGNVVYMTPPPSEITPLFSNFISLVNDNAGIFPLIKAPLAHLIFEKIHPFLDGNGRVGRLLFQSILAKHGYHFNWLLSIEELLQQKKSTYYALLDQSDATEFIEFMLQNMLEETERIKAQINNTSEPSEEDFLLPRRKEILQIIKDHTMVSFDQIQRRFLKIPARTLRYDIQQLEKQGFIRKIGTTRGAMYQKK
jgi:Fic family protein